MKLIAFLDSLCWLFFLLLLLAIPLPFGAYDSFYWSFFAAIASVLFCLVLMIQIMDQRANYNMLFSARYILFFLLLQYLYVLWQINVNGDFFQSLSLGLSLSPPEWFVPLSSMSAVPYVGSAWLAKLSFSLIVFITALMMINTRKRIRWAIFIIIISAIGHASLGILAKFSSVHLVEEQLLDGHFDVARGLFVNRNHYAAMVNYGIAMLSVSGFYAIYSKTSGKSGFRKQILSMLDLILSRKLVWLCTVLFSLLCITLSTSRAAMLGLVSSFFLIVILAIIFDRQFRIDIKWLLLIIISIVVIILINGDEGFLGRLKDGFISLGERHEQWRITWGIIQKYWLFGTGAGTYSEVFQYYREFGGLRQRVYNQSHSVFLQTLMEQGVIGFSFWVLSIFAMFWCLFVGFRKSMSRYMKSVILGVCIALIMALMQSLVDFNLLIPALAVYFYCLLAIGIAAGTVYLPKKTKPIKY